MPLASGMSSPGLMHDMSPEVLASVCSGESATGRKSRKT